MDTPHWNATLALQAAARGQPAPALPGTAAALQLLLEQALAELPAAGRPETLPQQPAAQDPWQAVQDCLDLCQRAAVQAPVEPVRTLHHLACTGGTLIAKCLAAVPNVQLLSEIDPLSTQQRDLAGGRPRFAPSDMVTQWRQSSRGVDEPALVALFQQELRWIHAHARQRGQRLLLRDHAHSHFCLGAEVPERPGLDDMVRAVLPTRSVVTVRHPLDSYLSLRQLRWVHFQPATFEAYCQRWHAFLDHHARQPVVRYEDFVADPVAGLRQLCEALDLPPADHAPLVFDAFRLTGDSGRGDGVIAPRPPRPLPPELAAEAAASPSYLALVARLGYAHRLPATEVPC
ncbi:sulfotransferase [Ideonella livida]|uniref:Sulfotransferase n=1 Tax=Ideonella livida TaxID=2707176 RepID=A0A7C9PKL0_9BURK|nr:sulfotransferase [Ideonella livida]NDY93412.1 sulfotransferase [Ideonella livida]